MGVDILLMTAAVHLISMTHPPEFRESKIQSMIVEYQQGACNVTAQRYSLVLFWNNRHFHGEQLSPGHVAPNGTKQFKITFDRWQPTAKGVFQFLIEGNNVRGIWKVTLIDTRGRTYPLGSGTQLIGTGPQRATSPRVSINPSARTGFWVRPR